MIKTKEYKTVSFLAVLPFLISLLLSLLLFFFVGVDVLNTEPLVLSRFLIVVVSNVVILFFGSFWSGRLISYRAKISSQIMCQRGKVIILSDDAGIRDNRAHCYFAKSFVNLRVVDKMTEIFRTHNIEVGSLTTFFNPYIFVKLQRNKVAIILFGNDIDFVKGKASGNTCIVQLGKTFQETALLINHELAHIVLDHSEIPYNLKKAVKINSKSVIRNNVLSIMHHDIMCKTGVDRAEYLGSVFKSMESIWTV